MSKRAVLRVSSVAVAFASCLILLSLLGGSASADESVVLRASLERSSLEVLSHALAQTALEQASGEPVRLRVESDWPPGSPRGPALMSKLQEAALSLVQSGADSDTNQLTLRATVVGSALRVSLGGGEAQSWWRRALGWPGQRWSASIALDAELRAYVATLPRLSASTVVARTMALPSRGYLALRVTDIDGDGSSELVLQGQREVQVVRLEPGRNGRLRLRLQGRVAAPSGPLEGVGVPRSFGTLAVDSNARVLVRWRRLRAPLVLAVQDGSFELQEVADPCPAGGHPLDDACAMPVDGRDYFASELTARVGMTPPERAPTSFYARARERIRRVDGSMGVVELVVTPRGRLVARSGEHTNGLAGQGAALALADVDQDGHGELLTSGPKLIGQGDQIHVFRILDTGGLRTVWSSDEIEGSVMVAGSGDLNADGRPELLAIEERASGHAQLWVIR